jgi:signal transduction histidine kinase/ActR/RegA family two-component response regulator
MLGSDNNTNTTSSTDENAEVQALQAQITKFERRLKREKNSRQQAEDLLEQKAADLFEKNQELVNLSEGLEKLVAQRTAQMQKARDEALTALQVKSDFIANMSHELRTPMNGVLGILTLLQDEHLNEAQQELLSIAQASGEHLLMVINDILDFSKIEASKIDLVMAPINIRTYISNLCKPFVLQAKQKGIDFSFNVEDDVPQSLISDKLRLTQIITNLLSNAIKFTNEGSVELGFLSSHNGNYSIVVSDTGIGISPENINAVFSAFEQADTSITREFGGTGLGMNITKRLVDMFGGKIDLQSTLGEGTRFVIDIKCDTANDDELAAVPSSTTNKFTDSAKVLLVEDNKINQLVAQRLLETWGINVTIAQNGQEAIDMLKTETFDLILMDLQMPIKGGIEATIEIRSRGIVSADVPIIAMTAHSTQEHVDECFAAGMQSHVSKPIDKDNLKTILESFLRPLADNAEHIKISASHHLPGVNIEDGLNRLNGDWTLLYTLIGNFLQDHLELKTYLTSCQNEGELEDAYAVLHRIKGSGGNLGFGTLSELAGIGEAKLKQNTLLTDKEIDDLQTLIDDVNFHYLKLASPDNVSEPIEAREESAEYLLQKMEEILNNLSKDMLSSEDALKDLMSCNLNEQAASHVQEANQAMSKFDIDGVAKAIKRAQALIDVA